MDKFKILVTRRVTVVPRPTRLVIGGRDFGFNGRLGIYVTSCQNSDIALIFSSFGSSFRGTANVGIASIHDRTGTKVILDIGRALTPRTCGLSISPGRVHVRTTHPTKFCCTLRALGRLVSHRMVTKITMNNQRR